MVDIPRFTIGHYHAVRKTALKNRTHKAEPEDLRQAMIYCHPLFKELAGTEAVIPERKKEMSEKYVGELSNTSDIVEDADVDMNSKAVNLDPHADKAPIGNTFPHEAPVEANAGTSIALLNLEDSDRFRKIWMEVQGKFVDEPRTAVEQADSLVSEVIEQLTQMFAHERGSLESQWNQGNDVSTEDLRQALLRYHSFFNRLVV